METTTPAKQKTGWRAPRKKKMSFAHPSIPVMIKQINGRGFKTSMTSRNVEKSVEFRFEAVSPGGSVTACTSNSQEKAVASVWRSVMSLFDNKNTGWLS